MAPPYTKPRATSRDVGDYVAALLPVRNSHESLYANHHGVHTNLYVAYSYGPHHPLYVYDSAAELWFGNMTKASRTTGRHLTMARPTGLAPGALSWMDTREIVRLIECGGYAAYCAGRVTA